MPTGILIIDKEKTWTSMDVCAKLRGLLRERRIGHAGTLDPMATGVLPVFVGRATRAAEFAEKGDKEYIATLLLGRETNTQDTTGETVGERPVHVTEAQLRAVLPQFTGELQQIPPMYSAIKVNGKRLYALARAGREVERPARQITVRQIDLLERVGEGEYTLRILCSKGTYVRTLCHDIGQALGCGGCMSGLRRTMAAGFTIGQAVTLRQVQQGDYTLLPIDTLFAQYPACSLNPAQERRCRAGAAVEAPGRSEGPYRLYGADGAFLSLSQWEAGVLRARKNFFGGEEPS